MPMVLPDTIDLFAYDWLRAQILQQMTAHSLGAFVFTMTRGVSPILPATRSPWTKKLEREYLRLWNSIRVRGYRPDLVKPEAYHKDNELAEPGSDVVVQIDSEGNVGVKDGLHRILCCLISGETKMPAKVDSRHPNWVAFCQRIYDIAEQHYTYEALPHPDFALWSATRGETRVSRVWPLFDALDVKTVADLGCCWGTFSAGIAGITDRVYAIDRRQHAVDVTNWLAWKYNQTHVVAKAGEIDDFIQPVDAIACLSVLHHLAGEKGVDYVGQTLKKYAGLARILLTELPEPGDAILANNPAGVVLSQTQDEVMREAGWKPLADLGPDPSFIGGGRRVLRAWESVR